MRKKIKFAWFLALLTAVFFLFSYQPSIGGIHPLSALKEALKESKTNNGEEEKGENEEEEKEEPQDDDPDAEKAIEEIAQEKGISEDEARKMVLGGGDGQYLQGAFDPAASQTSFSSGGPVTDGNTTYNPMLPENTISTQAPYTTGTGETASPTMKGATPSTGYPSGMGGGDANEESPTAQQEQQQMPAGQPQPNPMQQMLPQLMQQAMQAMQPQQQQQQQAASSQDSSGTTSTPSTTTTQATPTTSTSAPAATTTTTASRTPTTSTTELLNTLDNMLASAQTQPAAQQTAPVAPSSGPPTKNGEPAPPPPVLTGNSAANYRGGSPMSRSYSGGITGAPPSTSGGSSSSSSRSSSSFRKSFSYFDNTSANSSRSRSRGSRNYYSQDIRFPTEPSTNRVKNSRSNNSAYQYNRLSKSRNESNSSTSEEDKKNSIPAYQVRSAIEGNWTSPFERERLKEAQKARQQFSGYIPSVDEDALTISAGVGDNKKGGSIIEKIKSWFGFSPKGASKKSETSAYTQKAPTGQPVGIKIDEDTAFQVSFIGAEKNTLKVTSKNPFDVEVGGHKIMPNVTEAAGSALLPNGLPVTLYSPGKNEMVILNLDEPDITIAVTRVGGKTSAAKNASNDQIHWGRIILVLGAIVGLILAVIYYSREWLNKASYPVLAQRKTS